MPARTLNEVAPDIRDYLEGVVGAYSVEVGADIGVEASDRVRVATGRNRKSLNGGVGREVFHDPGSIGPVPSRSEFRQELKGKWNDDRFITQGAPYAGFREWRDHSIDDAIRAAGRHTKKMRDEAQKRGAS